MTNRAIVVTEVRPTSTAICDHGCDITIIMTNLLDGAVWQMCPLHFERHLAQALETLDRSGRGHADPSADSLFSPGQRD